MKLIVAILALVLSFYSLAAQNNSQPIIEDWESGDFTTLQWMNGVGQHHWEVTSEGAHSGRYCVRSGSYYTSDNESGLMLPVYLSENGTVSYYRRIFSAPGAGIFIFQIDGMQMDSVSGWTEWEQFQCPISAGFHLLSFRYHRNSNEKKGSDCVWMDDLRLPNGTSSEPPVTPCDAPEGLTATAIGNTINLSWNGNYSSQHISIYDDMESYEYGDINPSGTVGWSYIDVDGRPTSTFSSLDFLHEGDTMAYIVLDDESITGTGSNNSSAHSGHRYLGSPYHSTHENDDWIVSPRLNFTDTYEFAFYARSFSSQYVDEKFIIYYSLSDSTLGSFLPLIEEPITTTDEWTRYSFQVQPEAQFVAIRCVSYDQYIFCIDDISIEGEHTTGHTCNIYRDGTLLAADIRANNFTDSTVSAGNHSYWITYNCSNGTESTPSDTISVNIEENRVTAILDNIIEHTEREMNDDFISSNKAITTYHMAGTMEEMLRWNKYPTYEVYIQLLQKFQDEHPDLCHIDTILDSTPHPDLHHSIFAIHISNTLDSVTTKPKFLYSSTMHGSEVVGYYMMLHLADYILNNATTDTTVMWLLENVDLYICPMENPDGVYHITNDLIWHDGTHSTYHNYNDVQLNRNYPPLPGETSQGEIQPETQSMINFMEPKHFVMSVNFHCGAELINYPWDSWTTGERAHADADWFRYVGQNYASLCHMQDTSYMYGPGNGHVVIDGGDWGVVSGSRQDYMTYYQHCREVTMEISFTHVITDTAKLVTYWTNSKDALLSYATECAYGFSGVVTDAVTHEPLEAKITVLNHDRFNSEVYSHLPLGDYHRPIMAGSYTVEVSAPCHQTATFTITTRPGVKTIYNVELEPSQTDLMVFDQYLPRGMQATLVALAQGEVQWYDSDTASTPIATGSYFTTPALDSTTTYYVGEYYWEDSILCSSSLSPVTVFVFDTTTYVNPETDKASYIGVYPTPAKDYLIVDTNGTKVTNIAIYDNNGALVMQPIFIGNRIDISRLTSGTYYLQLETRNGHTTTIKFVKI